MNYMIHNVFALSGFQFILSVFIQPITESKHWINIVLFQWQRQMKVELGVISPVIFHLIDNMQDDCRIKEYLQSHTFPQHAWSYHLSDKLRWFWEKPEYELSLDYLFTL